MSTVQSILNRKGNFVATVRETDTVLSAAKVMHERRIGCVVVANGDQLIGIFTERDVVNRIVAVGGDPGAVLVGDVMTAPAVVCHPETPLAECAALITEKRLRHLPVLLDGKLCGMITSGDIMADQVRQQEQTIEYLQEYMHGQQK